MSLANVDLIRLSDDQMNSQYQVVFPQGIPGSSNSDKVALRMDQSITLPRESVGEYEIYYKGIKIVKTNMLEETDKHITIQVRIDQEWGVFDAIKKWKRMVHDPLNATRMAFKSISCSMHIQLLDGNQKVKKICKLSDCVLKEYEVMSVEPQGADPLRVELNIIFGTIDWEKA